MVRIRFPPAVSPSLSRSCFECREPRLSARLCGVAWRPGRQRRAGYFKIAPIGGNISVANRQLGADGSHRSTANVGTPRIPREGLAEAHF